MGEEKKKTKGERLSDLYQEAAALNELLPGDLMKKLTLYGKILELLGGFHASSLKAWKLAESERRETISTVFSLDPEGTAKEREMKAEMAATEARKKEAIAEAECQRWKNAFFSTEAQINIMKLQLKDMKELAGGGV